MTITFGTTIDISAKCLTDLAASAGQTADGFIKFGEITGSCGLFEGFVYRNGRGRAARYKAWMNPRITDDKSK